MFGSPITITLLLFQTTFDSQISYYFSSSSRKLTDHALALAVKNMSLFPEDLPCFLKYALLNAIQSFQNFSFFSFFFCFPHSLQIASPVSIAVQCGMIHLASRQASLGFASNSPNSLTKLEGQIGFPGCPASHLSVSTIIWFYSTVQNLVCSPQSNILSAILA